MGVPRTNTTSIVIVAAITVPKRKKLRVLPNRISKAEMGDVLKSSMVPALRSCTMDMAAKVTNKCCSKRTITAGVKKSVSSRSIPVTLSAFTLKGLVMTFGSIFEKSLSFALRSEMFCSI